MIDALIEDVFRAIKNAVDEHEAPGPVQWYVDDFVIDCDAEEFWNVVRKALGAITISESEPEDGGS